MELISTVFKLLAVIFQLKANGLTEISGVPQGLQGYRKVEVLIRLNMRKNTSR